MAKNGRMVDSELVPFGDLSNELAEVELAEPPGLPGSNPTLALQHMEAALVRADLECPDVLSPEQFRRLRYLLSFARLTVFEPGAAGPGGTRGRGDVAVGDEILGFRQRVIDALFNPLRGRTTAPERLAAAKAALANFAEDVDYERSLLLERHGSEFSAAELDAELGYKTYVAVLGGGGGAGYVYLGGMQRMLAAGLPPAYMLTNSFGAIVGSVMARVLPVPIEDYVAWAKTVTYRGVLGPARTRRRHGLNGLFSLQFDQFAKEMFTREDGEPMRLTDLAIPYETVVAGVRKQSFDRLPGRFHPSHFTLMGVRALEHLKLGYAPGAVNRLWQIGAFIDSRVVKPIVLGGDDLTANFNVVDAASFSSAIPGILHHESSDPRMWDLLDQLLVEKDVAALVDGGAASNVPVELAWKRIQDGRLGTRNACYIGWDCFHPQWNPRHLWLQPITQALQLQMVRNAPFADRVIRFSPTLSPVTLAAAPEAIDRAIEWGNASVESSVPFVQRLTEPVWWEGNQPPHVDRRPARVSAPLQPMATILDGARRAAEYVPRVTKVRRRVAAVGERIRRSQAEST
ncbi:patatin-like phospholipase family protein [Mycobacterium sp. CBMA226]|nr:patatin-like phospholipase family protein [Mycolicibacterium sp. CBMA 226]